MPSNSLPLQVCRTIWYKGIQNLKNNLVSGPVPSLSDKEGEDKGSERPHLQSQSKLQPEPKLTQSWTHSLFCGLSVTFLQERLWSAGIHSQELSVSVERLRRVTQLFLREKTSPKRGHKHLTRLRVVTASRFTKGAFCWEERKQCTRFLSSGKSCCRGAEESNLCEESISEPPVRGSDAPPRRRAPGPVEVGPSLLDEEESFSWGDREAELP